MANWCVTEYRFYSKNKKDVQEFQQKLKEITNYPNFKENDDEYLGNILLKLNLATEKDLETKTYDCWVKKIQSTISEKEGYYYFTVLTDDKWGPHGELFLEILDECYKGKVKMAYIIEEPECDICEKYDKDELFFSEYQYALDYSIPDLADDEYYDIEDLPLALTLKDLKEFFKANTYEEILQKIEEINSEFKEEFGEGYIHLYEYETVDFIKIND